MSTSPTLLEARSLSKRFPGTLALDAVNFDLRAGEVHALLGENGAGKSTLIKCLTGVHRRDGGDILLDGVSIDLHSTIDAQDLGIGTVYQEVNLLPNLSVAQNLLLGRQPTRFGIVDSGEQNRQAEAMLAGYELDVDVARPLGLYSVAIQQLVAIARATALSGKVLILDEPTASLDAREVDQLFRIVGHLKARGLGIVFISHFLDQVFHISDRLTVLRNGRSVGSKDSASVDRVSLINLMLGHELQERTRSHKRRPARTDTPAIKVSGLGRAGRVMPFDLDIHRGEVIGMAGLLGSGRTETAEMLFGITPGDTGGITVDGTRLTLKSPRDAINQGFGFCPEDRKTDGIIADLSVRENMVIALQAQRGWFRPMSYQEQKNLADDYVNRLDIRTSGIDKPVGQLSGGNQQKVILARWLAMNPRFLILDEPTRGIDVGAHAEIIRLIEVLCENGMSLMVISSELDELVSYSHRVVVIRDRQHVDELVGEEITAENMVAAIAHSDGDAIGSAVTDAVVEAGAPG